MSSTVGLIGLAVMGQNLALNVAEKGFPISVYNRSGDKTDACVARAEKEGELGCQTLRRKQSKMAIVFFSLSLSYNGGALLQASPLVFSPAIRRGHPL